MACLIILKITKTSFPHHSLKQTGDAASNSTKSFSKIHICEHMDAFLVEKSNI